jgi:hypothetical protein
MKPVALRLDRLETRLAPANAYWDGGGADNHWTTPANWVFDVAPQPGDDLYFPSGAAQQTNVNDFPAGTAFHSFHIDATSFLGDIGYTLIGNAVALTAGVTNGGGNGPADDITEVGLPLTLTADQTFFNAAISRLDLSGSVDLNGHALTFFRGALFNISGTITGIGSLRFSQSTAALFSGVGAFSGPTTVNQTTLQVQSTLPGPVTVETSGNRTSVLSGTGTVGDVIVNDRLVPGDVISSATSRPGTLKTGNLTLASTAQTTFSIFGPGSSTALAVTGTVKVGGQLIISPLLGFQRGPADQFTLIDNDGTDPVVGTFVGVPEGRTVTVGSTLFRITYHGGDGNDVVATTEPGRAYAVGAGPGGFPVVNVYSADGQLVTSFLAYSSGFHGGVRVATADVTGDGVPDIITAPGPGGGPHIRVFDGNTFAVVTEFMAYDPSFTGGVFVAAALINPEDDTPDIITGAGAGGGPHVKVFSGFNLLHPTGPADNAVRSSFFAYDARFTGGVSVAGTDTYQDFLGPQVPGSIVTGAGPGGGPHVRVFNPGGGVTLEFFAYNSSFRGGVNVAAHGNFSPGLANPRGEIVTAPASGGTEVRRFGPTGQQIGGFVAYDPRFLGGVSLAVLSFVPAAFPIPGEVTIVTGAGPGGGPHVKVWHAAAYDTAATLQQSFFAFDPAFLGGVFVG